MLVLLFLFKTRLYVSISPLISYLKNENLYPHGK